jgi:DNA-binding response OmpR family regulator
LSIVEIETRAKTRAKTFKEQEIKSKRRILLVDDEPDITYTLQKILERLGYCIDSYNDSALALDNFKASMYDLVILDIRMPKMNGYQLYERMKEIDQGLKACFMTANEIYEDDSINMVSELLMKCIIKKPVTLDELKIKVHMQLTN